jgi:hypothetical protein
MWEVVPLIFCYLLVSRILFIMTGAVFLMGMRHVSLAIVL